MLMNEEYIKIMTHWKYDQNLKVIRRRIDRQIKRYITYIEYINK